MNARTLARFRTMGLGLLLVWLAVYIGLKPDSQWIHGLGITGVALLLFGALWTGSHSSATPSRRVTDRRTAAA